MKTVKGYVTGRVQGVGFRNFVKKNADQLNVAGYAKNLVDKRVEFILQGESVVISNLLEKINRGPIFASVKVMEFDELDSGDQNVGFSIL
jgi:acylphosphatase